MQSSKIDTCKSEKEDFLEGHLSKRFDLCKRIGKGAYGIVWKVIEKDTGRVMALKRCFDAFHNSTDAQRTFREIMLLQELNGHDNIVRLVHVIKADNHLDLYIVFDYMQSDLQAAVHKDCLQPVHMEYIVYQILKALKYCHSGQILHRDLKPANVLLNPNCHVRICDFGLARGFGIQERDDLVTHALLTDYVATRWYRAPELLLGATHYGSGVDLWGLGCIFGEMLNSKPILKGHSAIDQIEKIVELIGKPSQADLKPILRYSICGKQLLDSMQPVSQTPMNSFLFLVRASEVARSFFFELLRFNPDQRPSAEDALRDPYLERFYMQEPEPTMDRIVRLPIPDSTKLKAVDYRNQIYNNITQWLRQSKEEEEEKQRNEPTSPSPYSARRSKGPDFGLSSDRSAKHRGVKQIISSHSERSRAEFAPQILTSWKRESGVEPPPSTPLGR